MYDPNPPPPTGPSPEPPSQQQLWWEAHAGRPPLDPNAPDYEWQVREREIAVNTNLLNPGEKHRVAPEIIWQNQPQNYPTGPVNTDPTTGGGGTGEFSGAPLGSGMARRPAQPQQGQPRPGGQFKSVQAQPRHVLRQAALQRPMNKASSGKTARPMNKAARFMTGGKR